VALASRKVLYNRLDVHDRHKFELKLEYQPSGQDPRAEYRVEMFMFLPTSLNVDADNYPREFFYWDIHNYVRLKTPVLEMSEILGAESSPLVRLEGLASAGVASQKDLVYQSKLLSCVLRGALRRFSSSVDARCREVSGDPSEPPHGLDAEVRSTREGVRAVLDRFRAASGRVPESPAIEERTRASLRLVDEYLSLNVEQFFRKAVMEMEQLPRIGAWADLRKELMKEVIREEQYRRARALKSVLSPTGDNEEYMHRAGFLKKFCHNILFLQVRRARSRRGLEEVLFATAAGIAMAFATAVAFWAQGRFTQASFNVFVILVVGYMMKDRIKEGMRRIVSAVVRQYLFDRRTVITAPVTDQRVGVCKEKVDYLRPGQVPEEIRVLRKTDDFVTVSQGELAEVLLHYQKEIVLDVEDLPRTSAGSPGVTDIIRLNVQRLLRDMDEPEYSIEYIDLEALRAGRVRGVKSYQVDLAFRFTFDDAGTKGSHVELFRLVLDRNGIKRMVKLKLPAQPPSAVRSVA
jgi:hypothetical protein